MKNWFTIHCSWFIHISTIPFSTSHVSNDCYFLHVLFISSRDSWFFFFFQMIHFFPHDFFPPHKSAIHSFPNVIFPNDFFSKWFIYFSIWFFFFYMVHLFVCLLYSHDFYISFQMYAKQFIYFHVMYLHRMNLFDQYLCLDEYMFFTFTRTHRP